jgi:hypothetical protein
MHGSLFQFMAEKGKDSRSAVGYQVGGINSSDSDTAIGLVLESASACEDSRRSKATCSIGQLQQWSTEVEVDVEVAKGREELSFVRRDEKREVQDETSARRSGVGSGKWWLSGLYGELQSWRRWRGAGAALKLWRPNRRRSTPPGIKTAAPTSKAKQSKAKAKQPSSPATKQTITLSTFLRAEGANEQAVTVNTCRAARCREDPRTRWQHSGVRRLNPTGSPQRRSFCFSTFSAPLALALPLPRMSALGRRLRGMAEDWAPYDNLSITRRGRTRFWGRSQVELETVEHERHRESQAHFGTLIEAMGKGGVESYVLTDEVRR